MATAARDVSRASESGRDGCERALQRVFTHPPAQVSLAKVTTCGEYGSAAPLTCKNSI